MKSTLSFGALERTNFSHKESIVEPCVSKNQKGISLRGFDWKENPERLRQWEKVFLS